MTLQELAQNKNIVLQCHDIPDADTVGAAFALQQFFKSKEIETQIVYGGRAPITKPSLLMLIDALDIKIDFVKEIPANTDLLITVDCQYGAGNVQKFECKNWAVIDHHRAEITEGNNTEIRPTLASCATLVWDLMQKENYDFAANPLVADALYYGLFTDTNGLAELRHPLDRDLADIPHNKALIKRLKNATITLPELKIISNALGNENSIGRIGLFKAEPCDPNILGFTSDVVMQVNSLDCVIVYCTVGDMGQKLSVRSCSREIMASEIAGFVCAGKGSGGGNIEKAGGFIKESESYLIAKVKEYTTAYDLIYAGETATNLETEKRYRKKPIPVGFVKTTDMFASGSALTVRTLEGDIDLKASEDIYIMIGIEGEVYPILKHKFNKNYTILDTKYESKAEYIPTVIDRISGDKRNILSYAHFCTPKDDKIVKARQISKLTKVFSYWDTEKYFSGKPGDYLAANESDLADCYIINGKIFVDSYEEIAS
ncbi:hypothetical protein AGMMS49938_03080 [Fibrobacterales bacterium]|nr:hypothetical protein AGMMS49938_03080 [Fibrobacterales bacterium]